MSVGILILLPTFVLVIAAVALIGSSRRRRRDELAGPVCGSCGYSVVGLTGMTCPECGFDLRHAGIITPHTPSQSGRVVGGVVVFSAVVCLVAILGSGAVISILPLNHFDREQVQLKDPDSGAYQAVALDAGGASYFPIPRGLPVRIDLTPNPGRGGTSPSSWLLARPDGGYEYVAAGAPRVVRPGAFGPAAVMEWMKAAGIDTAARSVSKEAARIAGETHLVNHRSRLVFATLSRSSSSSTSSGGGEGRPFSTYVYTHRAFTDRPTWPIIPLLLLWAAVWACGMRYLIGQGRKVARK